MPYGPGKFEGEPASTFLVYQASMEGADDDAGNHALFRGKLIPENISIDAAMDAGYTPKEVMDSIVDLSDMAGCIMSESEQGFVHVAIYDTLADLEIAWDKIISDYALSEE